MRCKLLPSDTWTSASTPCHPPPSYVTPQRQSLTSVREGLQHDATGYGETQDAQQRQGKLRRSSGALLAESPLDSNDIFHQLFAVLRLDGFLHRPRAASQREGTPSTPSLANPTRNSGACICRNMPAGTTEFQRQEQCGEERADKRRRVTMAAFQRPEPPAFSRTR